MWRRLLDKCSRTRRNRWRTERLEPRLLLSGDVLPAENVLSIVGTEGDDSALIQMLESETGGASQLRVILNGRAAEYSIEPGQKIYIDLLGGNDKLDAQITGDADWNIVLGDGNDQARFEVFVGDSSADGHYVIDAGEGDNDTEIRFGDGEQGRQPPADQTRITAEYRSGAGNDHVAIDGSLHLNRSLDFDLRVATGAGDDSVITEWEHQSEFRPGKSAQTDYEFELDTGEGNDRVDLSWLDNVPALHLVLGVDVGQAPSLRPEIGDEVVVAFEHGDVRAPVVIGALWNGSDAPPETEDTPARKFRLAVDDVDGNLEASTQLTAGLGSDNVQLYFQGKLKVGNLAPHLRTALDLGEGDNEVVVDFAGLDTTQPAKVAPIALDIQGGKNNDALVINGTNGADRFTVNESMISLAGIADIGYAAFDFLRIHALGGGDVVTTTGINPRMCTIFDGGDGFDRFVSYFDFDSIGNLKLRNFEQIIRRGK